MQLKRALNTRFRYGSETLSLNLATHHNSPAHSTKGTRSHLPCGVVLSLLVSIRFQVLFHSPPGVLFTVPSRYYTLSVIRSYLALGDGPPIFPPNFSCLKVLWILTRKFLFQLRGYYPILHRFPVGLRLEILDRFM